MKSGDWPPAQAWNKRLLNTEHWHYHWWYLPHVAAQVAGESQAAGRWERVSTCSRPGLDKIAGNGVMLVTADISSALMASTRHLVTGNLETCDHCPRPPAVIRSKHWAEFKSQTKSWPVTSGSPETNPDTSLLALTCPYVWVSVVSGWD